MNPISVIAPSLLDCSSYLRKDAVIVFVCGKRIDAEDSKRSVFIKYANKHLNSFHFLLAEDFFKFMDDKNENLLTIENKIADYSDSIIIILESESAFAELGAFAVSDNLCKIIIPVNDCNHVKSASFINLGPLKKIDILPQGLGPTVPAHMDSFAHCFSQIASRLDKIKRSNARVISFRDVSSFREHNKERMLFLYEIINLFGPIKSSEIVDFFIKKYGAVRLNEIHFDLPLLLALGFVKKIREYYISAKAGLSFIRLGKDINFSIRSKAIIYYKKKMPTRLALLSSEA